MSNSKGDNNLEEDNPEENSEEEDNIDLELGEDEDLEWEEDNVESDPQENSDSDEENDIFDSDPEENEEFEEVDALGLVSDVEDQSDSKRLKPSDLRAVVEANEKFSNHLLRLIGKGNQNSVGGEDSGGNTVMSPIGLSTVLAMVKIGASGSSDKELETALNLSYDSDTIKRGYKELLGTFEVNLNNDKNTPGENRSTLLSANRIYVADRYKLNDTYATTVKTNFLAEIEKVEFTRSQEAAAKINKWVSDSTNKKITNVISEGNLSESTAVVVLNALYFNGKWAQPFSASQTKNKLFYLTKLFVKEVKMMHKNGIMFYTAEKTMKADILRLNYKCEKPAEQSCYMLIYLPNEGSSVENVNESLMKTDLSSILKNMKATTVSLTMPKFKMNVLYSTVILLLQLGLYTIFSPKTAELKGIGEENTTGVHISDVVQKVYIDVCENGTEAPAATSCSTSDGIPEVHFEVNRPFVFQIVYQIDRNTPLVLFTGVCKNPLYDEVSCFRVGPSTHGSRSP